MVPRYLVILLVAGLIAAGSGCSALKYQQPPPLTQEEIISMARSGKTDEEIIQEIKTRRTHYRLSTKDILHLHDNGVSNPVIDYMLETYLQAVRDEQRLYDSSYYWHQVHGYWYYCPPTVIIKRR